MIFSNKKDSPIIKSIGLTTLFSILILVSYFIFFDVSERIGWEITGFVEALKTPLFSFEKWKTSFNIQSDSFLILEYFKGNNIILKPEYALIYGIILIIGFSLFLSSISRLTKLWHAISFGIFALLIGTLHLENLQILNNLHDKAFTGFVLLLYLVISFYFHFNEKTTLLIRFTTYIIISLGLVLLINVFTEKDLWYIESISYSFSSLSIISFLFIVFISLCIPFGILYITTFKNAGHDSDSLKHFYVFYIIYLLNLIYAYLNLFHGIDWGLYYLPPIFLFIISTIIGLWLINEQEELFGTITREYSILFWVYLGSSIITSSTYVYHISNFDTSFTIAFEQALTICFLGFGFLMLFYITYNFYAIIKQNLPVYKIAFKPKNIDFLSSWGVGLLITIGLFYINNFTSYRYLWTSYYNNLGDTEYLNDQKFLAEERYGMAKMYSIWNFHSNYMIAQIALDNKREDIAHIAYEKSSRDEGSEQSFIQMALIDIENKNYLESIIILKKGIEKFPSSKHIYNNLALAFYNINQIDSSLFYLDKGIQLSNNDAPILESNYLAISALAQKPINDNSKYLTPIDKNTFLNQSVNQLAYFNKNEINSSNNFQPSFINDSTLNGNQISYIYNYTLNNIGNEVSTNLDSIINDKLSSDHNLEYKQQLLFASYINHANQNEFHAGRHNLLELNQRFGKTNGYYLFLLGLEALQNNHFELATEQLNNAFKLGQKAAAYPLAMAATQLDDREYCTSLWDFVFKLGILSQNDQDIISYYLENKNLRGFSENEYYFQVLLNHPQLSIQEKYDGIMNTSGELQNDLIEVTLDYYIKNQERGDAKKFIQSLSRLMLDDKSKAKIIQTEYLLDLNSENKKLWIDQLDINTEEGKLYSDIFKETNFLQKKDKEQLFFNHAYVKYHTMNLLKNNETEEAFTFISDQLKLNPYSEVITNSYLETCFSLGLKDYAVSKKIEAEYLLSDDAAKRVHSLYASLLENYNQSINQWDTTLTE